MHQILVGQNYQGNIEIDMNKMPNEVLEARGESHDVLPNDIHPCHCAMLL